MSSFALKTTSPREDIRTCDPTKSSNPVKKQERSSSLRPEKPRIKHQDAITSLPSPRCTPIRATRSERIWESCEDRSPCISNAHSRSGDIRDHCRYSKNSPDKPPIRDRNTHRRKNKARTSAKPSPNTARRCPNMVQQPPADSIDSFDDLAAAFLKQHLRFALDDLVFCKTDDDTIYGLGKFGRLGRTIPHRESRQTRSLSARRQPRHHVRSPLELVGSAQVP
ncbi:unnamed protein product [Microthlaspi erraticum]|uniref:Uncharacterized protein n=1 Tax=Microthlaspi erraticum TaxID=1685480 RepID=A0A6D2I3S1_9BRAS|nr:unnamed protein product [Microthlaspi erraticum]